MTLSQHDWQDVGRLSGIALKDRVFSIFQELASEIQEKESDSPEVLGAVPRLADLIQLRPELSSFRELFGTLARSTGLWNYIDKAEADVRDEIVAEAASVPELGGITLHREQIAALNTLFSGRNLILSAPTSFGKSILIDALLASGRYNRVAIVLPTIALLDEFRRRLTRRFGDRFPIVMYHSQEAPSGRTIFLGTQERLVARRDLGPLDLAVVDEFYKLDPSRQDDRSLTLNAAVYQLLNRSKQFFFLGPNIESVRFTSDSRWRFEFLRTRFSTVAVDTFNLRDVSDKDLRLKEELTADRNWPALVFVSSPDRANRLASRLALAGVKVGAGEAFSAWIDENFGSGWELSRIVASGIGVHHARIPRAVASHFVRLFNSGKIPILLCTSTLIEGVNTAAKSVMIYDKTINRQSYDFFTFANIRGRAGRLGEHHVGSVFLFHPPPDHQATEVDAPLFADLDQAPDDLVVHISEEDSSPRISERVQAISQALGLTKEELPIAASVGLEVAAELREQTLRASRAGEAVHWSGYPRYQGLLGVCGIICSVRSPADFGLRTARQLAFFLTRLRSSGSMQGFFRWYTSSYIGDEASQDNVFKFLRSCEYGLPQLLSVVEMFAKRLDVDTDYSLILGELPRWFRAEVLKQLDEQGVPIQVAERFYVDGDTLISLSSRLRGVAEADAGLMSEFEREWIREALPSS
ncbi:hypothetical protein JNW90_16770 [Micromonospora sp. STR1s_5]|nr:hypothetical protein [Micromonospora sp. STR1s_5]